jgi:hypothetical protein
MDETQVTVTAEERRFLVGRLELALRDARNEERQDLTPTYREHVLRQEELIARLLRKVLAD